MTVDQKQCLLRYLGYYNGAIDGVWGAKSREATVKFQKAVNITVDGIAGKATEKALLEAIAKGVPNWWDAIEYFKRSEFACKCGKYCDGYPVEMDKRVVQVADRARKHFGKPMIISSGIRCEKHNAIVGGVSNSRHKLGKAIDAAISGVSGTKLLAYVEAQPEIRYAYIISGNYVHFDVT